MVEVNAFYLFTAAVVGILGWAVTSYIRLRRDKREGDAGDFDLFASMRQVALEQMVGLRDEVAELRTRIHAAEQVAAQAKAELDRTRSDLAAAIRHLYYLEGIMRAQGIAVPPRPDWGSAIPSPEGTDG